MRLEIYHIQFSQLHKNMDRINNVAGSMALDYGADPSIPNTNGETPLDLVENFYRDNPALDKFLAKAASGTPLPDW